MMTTIPSNFPTKREVVLDRGIRESECEQLTGLSRHSRWRLEKEGRFPCRRRTGLRSHHWLLSELMDWLRDPEHYRAEPPSQSCPGEPQRASAA